MDAIPDRALGGHREAARALERAAPRARAAALPALVPARGRRASCGSRWDEAIARITAKLRTVDPERAGLLRLEPRAHERDLLHVPEARPRRRLAARRQLRPALPRRLDHRPQGDARLGRADLLAQGPDRHRPRRPLRHRPREQPAGDDEVPALREEGRHPHRGGEPVPRAGARALLGAVGAVERAVRHADRRRLLLRSRRAATSRSSTACSSCSSRRAGSIAPSSTGRPRAGPRSRRSCARSSWSDLEQASGLSRAEIARFAELYRRAKSAVLVYSMGLTQHRFGVENVKAVVNLALARGNVGRPKTGIVPIRGHSGVQGTAECGVDPDKLPGRRRAHGRVGGALLRALGPPGEPSARAARGAPARSRGRGRRRLPLHARRQLPRHDARPARRGARARSRSRCACTRTS